MGATTLSKMVNSIFARTDENPASDSAVNAKSRPEIIRVVEALNMGYRQVFITLYGSLRPQVLDAITVSPGDPSYKVNTLTDVLKTMYVYPIDTPGVTLTQSNALELTQKFGALDALGDPAYWYRYDGTLSLYPVPASRQTFVVEGSLKFVELVNASDTTFLPEEHDYLLQAYAIAVEKAFWRDADAAMWKQQFDEGLDRLHAEALRDMPTKVYSVDPFADPTCASGEPRLTRYYT